MDSDNHHHHHHRIHVHHHNQQQLQNINSGLTRYRSAPSSYFSNIINSGMYGVEDLNPFYDHRDSSPESERISKRFMSAGDGDAGGNNLSSHQNIDQIRRNEFMDSMEQMMYQNHARSQEVVHNNKTVISSSGDRLRAMESQTNLLRQSSLPAGFFEQDNIDKGYFMMRSMNKFQPANGIVHDSSSFASASRSSSRQLTRIPEHERKHMTHNNGDYAPWDNKSSMLTDGFLNEFAGNDQISSLNQEKLNHEGRIQSIHAPTGLTHQLSLPTEFQENVPLRSRAKRGCATHPRSIAERVRRTRISERMRKLQNLVPNMDKQTSTADMLDLAIDYIKELQNLVETLSNRQTKCTCINKLKW